ncbi:MAG: purple acid phosphatase family protein [Myxococcota bacterium]
MSLDSRRHFRVHHALAVLLMIPSLSWAQSITRGPYLQMPGPDRMLVVWHTDLALTDPRVELGTTPALGTTVSGTSAADAMGGFKHSVQLSGLTAQMKYFYAVGSSAGLLTTPGVDFAFTTAPPHGTVQPIRIWTYGDSGYWPGRTATEYRDTRQAYYDYAGGGDVNAAADATDVMLFLGDNAYFVGNDATYQSVFFGPAELQAWLRRQPFFSAAGNHEGFAAGFDSVAQTGDYFEMFEFPAAKELGTNGVASGSEAYYSFDYANVHFVILDSEENIENIDTSGAAMLTWLVNDLQATTADWIIAAWHRPPYSKGLLHDSDVELNEIDMREVIVPVLEDHGVDVVLGGHSHTYERTPLIDGHYGDSTALSVANILDGGDGDPAGQGPYIKRSLGSAPHEGTVYIVAGSPADLRFFVPAEGHPAMVRSLLSLGSEVIEIDGDTLVGRFLDDTGAVLDEFRIEKGGCPDAPLPVCTNAGKGKLLLKRGTDPARHLLLWKWGKGAADVAALDPLAGNDLRLCAWDPSGKILDLATPNIEALGYPTDPNDPGPSWSWKTPKPGLFLYKDKALSASGLQKIKLKTGPSATLLMKAKGAGAGLPPLPLTTPVTAQLVNSDTGECWSTSFAAAKKNEAGRFVAVGP